MSSGGKIIEDTESKETYSSYSKYMNFGFFRNYSKNIGRNLEKFSEQEECVESILKFFCLLPQRESEVFQELVLNELLKSIAKKGCNKETFSKLAENLIKYKK